MTLQSHLGIFTKEYDEQEWSEWRGRSPTQGSKIEPIQLLKEHSLFHPCFIKFENFNQQRIEKMAASFSTLDVC